jgi:hypothetical protein
MPSGADLMQWRPAVSSCDISSLKFEISLISSKQPVGTTAVNVLQKQSTSCKMPSSSSSPAAQAALQQQYRKSHAQAGPASRTLRRAMGGLYGVDGTAGGGARCSAGHTRSSTSLNSSASLHFTHLLMSKLAGSQHTHPRRCHRAVAGVWRLRITPLSSSRATGCSIAAQSGNTKSGACRCWAGIALKAMQTSWLYQRHFYGPGVRSAEMTLKQAKQCTRCAVRHAVCMANDSISIVAASGKSHLLARRL